jgi:broad specificity phosphatase PhoE
MGDELIRLHLVRHAASAVDFSSPPGTWGLTEEGKIGAARAAEILKESGATVVAAAPMPKAEQTAAAIAAALGLQVVRVEGLEEHHRAATPVLGTADFHAAVRSLFDAPDRLTFGLESGAQARARFAQAVDVATQGASGAAIIVSGATVMCLYVGDFGLWRRLGMPAIVTVTWPSLEVLEVQAEV